MLYSRNNNKIFRFSLVHHGTASFLIISAIFMILQSANAFPFRSSVTHLTANYGRQTDKSSYLKMSFDDNDSQFQKRKNLFPGRRDVLAKKFIPAILVSVFNFSPVNGVVMENNGKKIFEIGKDLTEDQAIARLKEGRESLQYLLENYDQICEGGGDNVRRYLGTVGITSGLYGISKVMKSLSDQADDIVEYTETMNEIEKCIQQADGSAYMAIFVTTSTSSIPPSKYFGDAKIEIKRCVKSMDELFTILNIKV